MKKTIPMRIRSFFDTHRKNEYQIKPYLLKDGKKHPVAIICPGGGYRRVCTYIEGHPFAKKLNKMGFHAVVVCYRVRENARFPNPQDDLARAIRVVMDHAEKWNIDMTGYSVWGSSAGGHLAASFGTESMGWKKYGLPRPGALVLVYPVITLGEHCHEGSRNNHLGPSPAPEAVYRSSIQNQVTDAYPPTFLWWGADDTCVPPINSNMLQAAMEQHQVPCLCREYPDVEHGVGLGTGLPCEGWINDAVKFWMAQI